jgi:hypothetical protein
VESITIELPISTHDAAHYSQVLTRLKKMKGRWRLQKPIEESLLLLDRIRFKLTSERARNLRAQIKWFAQAAENHKETVAQHLATRDGVWRPTDDRERFNRLEYRHGTNVPPPAGFDKYDRPQLESWLTKVDPAAVDGKSTMEMRRIAGWHSYADNAPSTTPDAICDDPLGMLQLPAAKDAVEEVRPDAPETVAETVVEEVAPNLPPPLPVFDQESFAPPLELTAGDEPVIVAMMQTPKPSKEADDAIMKQLKISRETPKPTATNLSF